MIAGTDDTNPKCNMYFKARFKPILDKTIFSLSSLQFPLFITNCNIHIHNKMF